MNQNQVTLIAHPGTQYSFHLAREVYRHDELSAFYTCLAFNAESKLARWMSPFAKVFGMEKEWQNRLLSGVPTNKLHCYPALEVSAQWRIRRGESALSVLRDRNDRFQREIPERALAEAQAVIGFDTSSHILASRANAFGEKFILDRSIGYAPGVNGLFESLRERYPEWSETSLTKSETDLEIEDQEHTLAHLIVVPSKFVAQTLIASDVPASKIRINPFGADLEMFTVASDPSLNGPMVFLFIGALSARKGLPLLLQAWDQLKATNAELWIAGPGTVPDQTRRSSPDSVKWLGPVSRQRLPGIFQRSHVFVFPSYFEGLAQVQIEAAACGLPVIGTTASGAAEIIADGETGYIIDPGNLEQLVERLREFIARPQLAREMREQAKIKRAALSWSAYGDRWSRILHELN